MSPLFHHVLLFGYILLTYSVTLSSIREPGKLYEELEQEEPLFCPPYSMGGMVKPFGFESMPEKWPGSSSTFGRRVSTNCHAEYPDTILWGKEEIKMNLYNKHYSFKRDENALLSTYPEPSHIVSSEALSNGYHILLLQLNGVFWSESIPSYDAVGKWYPKTWAILILHPHGDVVAQYRHLTREMVLAARTGITRDNSLNSNINKALQIEFRLDIPDEMSSRRRLLLDTSSISSDQKQALSLLISYLIRDLMPSIVPQNEIFDTESSIALDPKRFIFGGVSIGGLHHDEEAVELRLKCFVYPYNNLIAQMIQRILINPQFSVLLSTELKLTKMIDNLMNPLFILRDWYTITMEIVSVKVSDIPPSKQPVTDAPTKEPTKFPTMRPTPRPTKLRTTKMPTAYPVPEVEPKQEIKRCVGNEIALLSATFKITHATTQPANFTLDTFKDEYFGKTDFPLLIKEVMNKEVDNDDTQSFHDIFVFVPCARGECGR